MTDIEIDICDCSWHGAKAFMGQQDRVGKCTRYLKVRKRVAVCSGEGKRQDRLIV